MCCLWLHCHNINYQLSVIKLIYRAQNFITKMQSEARLEGKVLFVHVTAEVMIREMIFETRKSVTLSQLVWQTVPNSWSGDGKMAKSK